jgi:hypothetical protein
MNFIVLERVKENAINNTADSSNLYPKHMKHNVYNTSHSTLTKFLS